MTYGARSPALPGKWPWTTKKPVLTGWTFISPLLARSWECFPDTGPIIKEDVDRETGETQKLGTGSGS